MRPSNRECGNQSYTAGAKYTKETEGSQHFPQDNST